MVVPSLSVRYETREIAVPRKVSRRMLCAFCGLGNESALYLEVEVTVPEALGPQSQLLGVHLSCLNSALAEGFEVEHDLLVD